MDERLIQMLTIPVSRWTKDDRLRAGKLVAHELAKLWSHLQERDEQILINTDIPPQPGASLETDLPYLIAIMLNDSAGSPIRKLRDLRKPGRPEKWDKMFAEKALEYVEQIRQDLADETGLARSKITDVAVATLLICTEY